MSTTQPGTADAIHPFTAALARRDLDALVASLAADAVLHSAITSTEFHGRAVLRDIYASLFDAFEEVEVTDRFRSGDTEVFFWRGTMDGRFVEGADRIRLDADGQVQDITIVGRPLTGLASFVTALGFHFARRRRGARIARLLRVGALPLPRLFALLDRVTAWVARGRA